MLHVDGHTDGWTDMTKLILFFAILRKVPDKKGVPRVREEEEKRKERDNGR